MFKVKTGKNRSFSLKVGSQISKNRSFCPILIILTSRKLFYGKCLERLYLCEEAIIKSANWHITIKCNYNCKFCFSRRLDKEIEDLNSARDMLDQLKNLGIEKITITGGEPLLHPLFFDIAKMAKDIGFVVSMVSNGSYLNANVVSKLSPFLDWIGLSIDSANEIVETALGRGSGNHVENIKKLARCIHKTKIRLKINTTVTKLNYTEDMEPLIEQLKPERWKIFQVLPIKGQNDCFLDQLLITKEEFFHFKNINNSCAGAKSFIFESNEDMINSYFILSPAGKIVHNLDGTNNLLTPLSEVDRRSLSQVIDSNKYKDRGAIYPW